MAQHKVEGVLVNQSEVPQIRLFWENIAQFNVIVFQGTLLPGLHGVTKEYPCAAGAIRGGFHVLGGAEFTPPVSEQDVYVLAEEPGPENLFEEADPGEHGSGSFFFLQESKEQTGIHKLESLDERAAQLIIVDGVHLRHEDAGVLVKVRDVVLVGTSLQVAPVLPFLIGCGLCFGKFPGDLSAQIHDGYAGHLMKHIGFDVVIDGFLTDAEFRMSLKDLVGGEALLEERTDDVSHGLSFRGGQIDADSGVNKSLPVGGLSLFGVVIILVEAAPAAV